MNRLAWFAMLAILPVAAQEKQKAAPPPPPKPPAVKPQLPPRSAPVENEEIDKRRDRMKQRDSEIDKILKDKQRKEAERKQQK